MNIKEHNDFIKFQKMAKKSMQERNNKDAEIDKMALKLISSSTPFSIMVSNLRNGLKNEDKEKVIECGNNLFDYGGDACMHEATEYITSEYKRLCDMWFDGIGGWVA